MPGLAVPESVANLFQEAHAPLELLDRVDQTWFAVVGDAPEMAAADRYVRAVTALSTAVLDSVVPEASAERPDISTVVTAASLAPVTEARGQPWQAVLLTALEFISAAALGAVAGAAVGATAGAVISSLRSKAKEESEPSRPATPGVVHAISDVLTGVYETPLDAVRRVFQPRGEEELGRWLGVSRTTVSDWAGRRFAPNSVNDRRLQTIAAIARLVDQYIDPEDVQLYLRSTALPAFEDRTLDKVLSAKSEGSQEDLDRALGLLRFALVQ